jgi:1,4-dihydroxy-2-naphthoate octaprenyltransferase
VLAASVHYANEYADYWTDALTARTPFSGGSGGLQATGLDRSTALSAAGAALAVGTGLAGVCARAGHLPTAGVVVLATIVVLGWWYSLGPLALAWHGLGELDNAVLGGLLLPAYGYAVQAGSVSLAAVAAFLPFALVVFCNLLATTWPDRRADAAVGKATLATRWPADRLRRTYVVGAVLAGLALVAGPGLDLVPPVVAGAGLVGAPGLAVGARRYTRRRSPFPTVAAMVAIATAQAAAWAWLWVG